MTSKILLVDDEPRILEVLSSMLMELGHEVRAASGRDEALALVRHEKFHIAFVDNRLGPLNGIDLIEQLAKFDPDLDFVIMTDGPNIEAAIYALRKGVSDFLRKPFRVEDLMGRIELVKRRRELDRELRAGSKSRKEDD